VIATRKEAPWKITVIIRTKVAQATSVLSTSESGLWTDVHFGAQVGVTVDDLADSSEIVAAVYKYLLLIGLHGKGNANTNEQDKHEWEHFFHGVVLCD